MKPIQKFFVVFAIVIAQFVVVTPVLAQSNRQIIQLRDKAAFASFVYSGDDAFRIANVLFVSQSSRTVPSPTETSCLLTLSLLAIDWQTSTVSRSITGSLEVDPGMLSMNQTLTEATLVCTIQMTDNSTGLPVTVNINLSWQGEDPVLRDHQIFQSSSDGRVITMFRGMGRNAVVSGTLSDGTTNFGADPSNGATLFKDGSGAITMAR